MEATCHLRVWVTSPGAMPPALVGAASRKEREREEADRYAARPREREMKARCGWGRRRHAAGD